MILQKRLEILQRIRTTTCPQLRSYKRLVRDRMVKSKHFFKLKKWVNTNLEVTAPNLSLQVEIDKQLKI
jgi:hypothetical protein